MSKKYLLPAALLTAVLFYSCEKDPGKGGNNSIQGYVHVTEYQFIIDPVNIIGEHPGYDEKVYIIYGDETGVGDNTDTGPDGKFEFKFLREGKYKVYIYSRDSGAPGLFIPDATILKTIEIKGKKKTIDAGTFEKKKIE